MPSLRLISQSIRLSGSGLGALSTGGVIKSGSIATDIGDFATRMSRPGASGAIIQLIVTGCLIAMQRQRRASKAEPQRLGENSAASLRRLRRRLGLPEVYLR